ncbi:MAG: discoidin domain-containing protein [Butyricimonas faecihominis]
MGKNRYLHDAYKDVVTQSVLTDTAGSRFALEVLHELKGVEVERYNKHYFPKSFSALSEKGKTEMPVLNYLTTAKITVTPADQSGYDAHPELLLDDDQITIWNPQQKNTFRQHELLIDLGKVESVAGFKVVQDATSPINNPWDSKHNFRPSLLKVLVSKDLASWEGATFDEDNEIGNTAGEITLLRMEQAKEIRYIKVTVSDLAYYSNFCVILADFVAFSE